MTLNRFWSVVWDALRVAPAWFTISAAAIAAEPPPIATYPPSPPPSVPAATNDTSLEQILQYSNEGNPKSNPALSQLTSITQLTDVQPTDWAYQALQSLVERYGCIVGYPDSTFKGSRALTRYEFAAGLNACLDRISELLASSTANLATKEDLATLQRLQEEFAAELASLRGRVDSLEASVTELEANQFSTTTKLSGETIFSIANIFGDKVDNNQPVFQTRVRLAFETSFTGNDLLYARLQYDNLAFFDPGENQEPRSYRDGNVVPMVAGISPYDRETSLYYQTGNDDASAPFYLDQLLYTFPIGDHIEVSLAAIGASISDLITSVSPLDDEGSGAVGLFAYNPVYDAGFGTGGTITYTFTDAIQLSVGYLSGTAQDSTPAFGLFNGNYAAFAQLTLMPGDFSAALIYVNTYSNAEYTDLPAAVSNQYGITVNYAINDDLNVGGWFNYEAGILLGEAHYRSFTYAGYVALNNLGAENNQLALIVGVPPRIADYEIGNNRIGEYIDDASLNVEASYRISIGDYISVTPAIIYIADPGNNNDNSDVFIGVLRTTFNF